MNKISKKIVALATMAAFVLTLVPAAAFGAVNTPANVSLDASGVAAQDDSNAVTVTAGDTYDVKLLVQDQSGLGLTGTALDNNPNAVKIWATEDGQFTDAVTVTDDSLQKAANTNIYRFKTGESVVNGVEFEVSFERPGTYVLHAGVGDVNAGADDVDAAFASEFKNCLKTLTVTVEQADVTAEAVTLTDENNVDLDFNNGVAKLDLTEYPYFEANGTDTYTIDGIAYQDADKTKIAAYETFAVTSSNTNVLQVADSEVTTRNDGTFEITFSMFANQNANITLSNEKHSYTIRVLKDTATPENITTVADGGYVLDGATMAEYMDTDMWNFSDAVQFEITDENGDVVTGPLTEAAASNGNAVNGIGHDQALRVLNRPDDSELTSWDLVLAENNTHDGYTLAYAGGWTNIADKLVPGEYTVRVALASGSYADASFNVAEFGTVQDIVIDMQAKDSSDPDEGQYWATITDKVMLGQTVKVSAKYVDENGLKVPVDATRVQFGFNSNAKAILNQDAAAGIFRTQPDTVEHQSLIGSTITVSAFDSSNRQLVQETLTVVDSYDTYTLAFDPTEGPAGEDNTVGVSVVDADGDVVRSVDGTIDVYLADQSNEDANVTLAVDNDNVVNGRGEFVVYSDVPTTVEAIVAVNDGDGHIYAGTLEYNVGDADVNADRSVVMTIGSTEYVVNNNIITGDAAPYVDSAWRTMVPIRALAEAFDATVTYENDDQTVTIVDGGTEVVMTIGEATYTVNGEEQTMDTEAVIGDGDRTYVPIRFTAEALGYTVTPLYDANGLTASVVFQR